MIIPNIWENIIDGNQTTHQIFLNQPDGNLGHQWLSLQRLLADEGEGLSRGAGAARAAHTSAEHQRKTKGKP